MVAFCAEWIPKWNPMNVCSYHLQEAGATPTQEIAYALATAVGVLDAVRESGQVPEDRFPQVFASDQLLRELGHPVRGGDLQDAGLRPDVGPHRPERYGITDERARRFRYGVQVNSLGLTEAQPENNVQRIVLEMLGVTLSRTPGPARSSCRRGTRPWACPGRGTSSGRCACSRSWPTRPTCWSTADLFEGSKVVEARTAELVDSASAELDDVLALGGAPSRPSTSSRAGWCAATPSGSATSRTAS